MELIGDGRGSRATPEATADDPQVQGIAEIFDGKYYPNL